MKRIFIAVLVAIIMISGCAEKAPTSGAVERITTSPASTPQSASTPSPSPSATAQASALPQPTQKPTPQPTLQLTPERPPSTTPFLEETRVSGTDVNMRASANTEAGIVAKVGSDTKIEVLGEENGWYRVRASGAEGYIRKDFIIVGGTAVASKSTQKPARTSAAVDERTPKPEATPEVKADPAPTPTPDPTPTPTPEQKGRYPVYWVSGGEVYHYSEGCRSLARSSNIQEGSIEESKKPRGCKNCT